MRDTQLPGDRQATQPPARIPLAAPWLIRKCHGGREPVGDTSSGIPISCDFATTNVWIPPLFSFTHLRSRPLPAIKRDRFPSTPFNHKDLDT
ncbi:MAG TPA: hypothetical protein DCY79_25530 [Planctomycetaceae bacterium]|nr:hypothetical protein [Planctomycetaceae bacterium]